MLAFIQQLQSLPCSRSDGLLEVNIPTVVTLYMAYFVDVLYNVSQRESATRFRHRRVNKNANMLLKQLYDGNPLVKTRYTLLLDYSELRASCNLNSLEFLLLPTFHQVVATLRGSVVEEEIVVSPICPATWATAR